MTKCCLAGLMAFCSLLVLGCASINMRVTNLQAEAIEKLHISVDGRDVGAVNYNFGPLWPNVARSASVVGSNPQEIIIDWESGGVAHRKALKLSRKSSQLIQGGPERLLVFVSERQIPLLFIDFRDSPKNKSRYYNIQGEKLSKDDVEVLDILTSYDLDKVKANSEMLKIWANKKAALMKADE